MVVTFGLSAVTGIRSNVPGAVGILLAYSLACAVLTWPVLLLAAGALWGKWE
jgi:Ca2+/H+ antiporter